MSKIESLTKEQSAKLADYAAKWIKIGLSTDPVDMIETVKYIKDAYRVVGQAEPSYFIGPVAGPYEAAVAEALVVQHSKNKTKFKSARDLNERIQREVAEYVSSQKKNLKLSINSQIYGFQEYWLSYYDFFMTECGIDLEKIKPLMSLANHCGWWTPMTDVAIVQNRPVEIHRDDRNRLHCTTGPAVKYTDNSMSNVYAVHGVRVTKKVIDRNFSVDEIENEGNAEVRRVMINIYGQSKYLMDSGAKKIHTDDFGTLYVKNIPNDEPLMMVKVINSTEEPDGSYKEYFIRVDPNAYGGLKTARAAVASTFRNNDAARSLVFKSPEDYNPEIQT